MTPSLPDEAELVRRARQGDAAAFCGLVDLHAETLWRCARALCRDDHEAEDIVQETLVDAWRSLPRFDGRPGSPPGCTAFSGTGF